MLITLAARLAKPFGFCKTSLPGVLEFAEQWPQEPLETRSRVATECENSMCYKLRP